MRRVIISLIFLMQSVVLIAQERTELQNILAFLGADSEEELDSYEVERLENYLSRPLQINCSSPVRLISSGLMTQYQVASLKDYISRNGDVLSLSELAAVDGFDRDFVNKLAPFISLLSYAKPGYASLSDSKKQHDISLKSGYKRTADEAGKWQYGNKYRMTSDRGPGLSLSLSKSYDAPALKLVSGNLKWGFMRSDAKIILGDFNARFGQGLAMWNSMVMNGLSSVSSFSRRASGISETWSYTGSNALSGAAVSISSGRMVISALAAVPGIKNSRTEYGFLPAVNVAWYGKKGQFSITDFAEFTGFTGGNTRIPHMKTAADFRLCLKGIDLFSEVSYDWVNSAPAFLSGSSFPVAEGLRAAALLRLYPSDYDSYMSAAPSSSSKNVNEAGIALAGEYMSEKHKVSFSFDTSAHPQSRLEVPEQSYQIKALLSWQYMFSESFCMSMRLSERYRNYEDLHHRTDLRLDLSHTTSTYLVNARINALKSDKYGFLSYLEGGLFIKTLTMYLRQGIFLIDDWDDRIYAYERNAPGNFSVPAYYGRGLWTAFNLTWKYARWGKLYAKASFQSYPFMEEEKKKPGKAELKLQAEFSF